jgi:3-deoxy-D-manno-octulosonate cytidylyltransferase
MVKLFDCTLRDGGYINNWSFSRECVKRMHDAVNKAGIEYVELGYMDNVDLSEVQKDKSLIFLMVDYREGRDIVIPDKFDGVVDGIRVCAHKSEISDAIDQIKFIKNQGYITSLQMMGITNYSLEDLKTVHKSINSSYLDILSIADSNGSLFPCDIKRILDSFKGRLYDIGFHSHNNLQLSLANAIEAINCGVDIIDCTCSGIGRGAGNLPTELIISYINRFYGEKYRIMPMFDVNQDYILPLKSSYNWGYNIPQMIGGMEGLHPYYARDMERSWEHALYNKLKAIGKEKPMKYHKDKKIICVIPSRYKSSRFPGKSLAMINGYPMIYWVYQNAKEVDLFSDVIVATDSKQIVDYCDSVGFKSMMTSESCKTGTDRTGEVSDNIKADLYINLQGDEPLIMPETIENFTKQILNLGEIDRYAFDAVTTCSNEDIDNINVPKVAMDTNKDLLFMSRARIPQIKSTYTPKYYKELGLHAYTKKALDKFRLSQSEPLELAEELEYLRFLENGMKVRLIDIQLPFNNHAVDVPEDVVIVERIINEKIQKSIHI